MSKLQDVYYQPQHMWKGQKALKELKKNGFKSKEIRSFLSKQAFWQIHLPPPRKVIRPHYEVKVVNQVHQFDLLYMPEDKLYGNKYKYILSGIDVASRYKVARPLRTKQARDIADMIADIYKKGPLKWPKVFQCDNGTEFKAEVIKLLEKHNVVIRKATTKYFHSHTAFVESLNKTLAQNLFKIQDVQELNDAEKVSTTWVKHLYKIVEKLNDTKTSMIGMTPNKAIKLDKVSLVKKQSFPPEDTLPESGLYRYLLLPGEENKDTRKRATDNVWSRKTFRLSEVVKEEGNRTIYYLQDGPVRSFVREELMLVPEDTQLPPDYVQEW